MGLPGHHVAERAAHRCRVRGGRNLAASEYLGFGTTRQHPLRSFQMRRQHGAHGSRIEACWRANFRIPELGIVQLSAPGAINETHETVLPLYRCFITAL